MTPFYKKPKPTTEALKLGEELESYGWFVEYEKFDGYKHIDIAIVEARVNIEVDGPLHNSEPEQALADLARTYYSFKKGFLTLRIPNCLVSSDQLIQTTGKFINKFLKENYYQ